MSDPIPQKQRAWLVVRRGQPREAVVLNEHFDVPSKLPPGDVLIKVQAAALNPVGPKVMALAPNLFVKRPHVAEIDFTGIVVDANGSVFQNGQAVYGVIPMGKSLKTGEGALAQYTRCPANALSPRPSFLKPTEAAGLGVVGVTAYHAIFNMAKLEPGQSIFINGGSTGVGLAAIQMAKSVGCKVTACASAQREELLKSLGVDVFIDYKKAPAYKQLLDNPPSPKFHAILEAVGNTDVALYTNSEAYLAPGGLFISVGPFPHGFSEFGQLLRLLLEMCRPAFLGGVKRKFAPIMGLGPDDISKYGQLVEEGKVKPIIDSVYSFEDVHKAYDRIQSQRAAGKVVIKVDPDVE